MMIRASRRTTAVVTLAFLSGAALGALATLPRSRADDHAPRDLKAPVREVLHCPLAFAGVHLQKDRPENAQVAYHFCKPLASGVAQCVLYDGTGPEARLIGVEYLIGDALYRTLPADEQAYWHDHKHEVDAGLIKSLTQSGDEERATLADIRPRWGKVYHTWVEGDDCPRGPARLFWSVTGEAPFVLAPGAKLPAELKADKGK